MLRFSSRAMIVRCKLSATACLVLLFVLSIGLGPTVSAQVVDPQPTQRQLRTYIPPDQLVTFSAQTPFNQFVEFINPLFQRMTGKAVVDLTERTASIGINISGLQFIDAFELVLEQAGLTYRETERYFLIDRPEVISPTPATQTGAAAPRPGPAISAREREIQIDAIIFEVNLDRFREAGTNWGAIFGEGGGTGGGGTGTEGGLRLFLNTESVADRISDYIIAPDRIDFAEIVRLFRYFETIGVGETVANPSIVVRSGQEGRIQSGSDIPVTLRDFAGNTVTQYIPTGIIINALPRLIIDDTNPEADPIEFIHLAVQVERSAGRLGATGIIIDKNQATTEVLLLDGEQTAIGGLYSTEESVSRRGIPILMDIPILRHLFSYRTRSVIERELVIVLQTRLLDSLPVRAARPLPRNAVDRALEDKQREINRALPEPPRQIRRPNVRDQ